MAWVASALPLLGALLGWSVGGSLAGLCLLPWLALAGLPRSAPRRPAEDPAAGPGEVLFWLGLALPPVALAARIDAVAGRGGAPLLAGFGLLLVLVLAHAAGAARRDSRTRGLYAVLWLVLLPGLPLLLISLSGAVLPARGDAPALLAFLSSASPLAWCLDASFGEPVTRAELFGFPLGAAAVGLVLAALPLVLRRAPGSAGP